MFEDWAELVEIVGQFPWEEQESLWVVPKYCRHSFTDFARVRRVGPTWQNIVAMDSFRVTVSLTHSCDALVVQLLSDGLARLDSSIALQEVSHFAVLPSKERARVFSFTGQRTCRSRMGSRAARQL